MLHIVKKQKNTHPNGTGKVINSQQLFKKSENAASRLELNALAGWLILFKLDLKACNKV